MYLIKLLKKLINRLFEIDELKRKNDDLKILTSKILINQNSKKESKDINEHEFRAFSQFGEDGIIQFLIKNVKDIPKSFIEFGVEDYEESNTRFLLLNNNWSGLILDSDIKNINKIKKSYYYWKHDLIVQNKFIDIENINSIIEEYLKGKLLGILSIDIDGNDYWIFKKLDLEKFKPIFIISEYNSILGKEHSLTIPYKADFIRQNNSVEKLYYGSSIKAISNLAKEKGYSLLGSNLNGNNLFFVRNKYANLFKVKSINDAYVKSKFKEFSNVNFEEGYNLLKSKDFYDTETKKIFNFD